MANPTLQTRKLLNQMAHMGEVPQIKTFRKAVQETGGVYAVPEVGDRTGSHLVEVCLYGITASGRNELEAVVNWKRCAYRALNPPEERAPVADVPLQVTTLDHGGNLSTVEVLIDGNTPANRLVEAAGRALISQTEIQNRHIAKVSVIAMHSTAPVEQLDNVLRSYHAGQRQECA